ncbi:hypothetical protein [Cyclobacterium plantarum]|uniref:Lipid/polyisoprenoid-binding YceI-like domain-containing protein n=1 Tax=Cyclobacterium plantarum TaxID=2716263 RepID=A0ABX0HCK5_9BACT|nr:hypothetical protein [Cyclobacterium plantarum]NHE59397.1 hypothetical protein [Cyclobacterium plantarum]
MNRIVKKIGLVFFLATMQLLTSCSKTEDPAPEADYFMKFRINGEWVEYRLREYHAVVFSYDANGGIFSSLIQALGEGSTGSSDFFSITLWSEEVFEERTYQLQDGVRAYESSFLPSLIFSRSDLQGNMYNAALLQQNYPTISVPDNGSLTLTHIGNDLIEGTFEATLFGPISPSTGRGDTELKITEGSFRMKLIVNLP